MMKTLSNHFKESKRNGIFSIYQWVLSNQKNNKLIVFILFLSIVINVITVCLNPIIFKFIFDDALTSKNTSFLIELIFILVVLYLLSVFATITQSNISANMAAKTINKTRLELFNIIQNIKLNEKNSLEKSSILTSSTQNINFLEYTISQTIWIVVQYAIMGIVSALLLIYIDIYMTLLSVILIPFLIIISGKFRKISEAEFNNKTKIENDLYRMEDEGLSLQEVIRYLKMKNYKRKIFKNLLKNAIRTSYTYNFNLAMTGRTTVLGISLITILIMGIGVYRVILGVMTVGTLIGFLVLLENVGSAINFLSSLYPNLSQGSACLDEVRKLLNIKLEYKPTISTVQMQPLKNSIQYKNISARYDHREILSNINLYITSKQFVSFVGQSGSGKSTLLKLLIREITPSSGKILLDDVNIEEVSLHSLYSAISVVHQNPNLFDASIKENIRLGKINASDEEIVEAAKLAEIHDDIMRLPEGYDTFITKKNLSGGQYQRIAIARALITKPSILCLDEATVGLDLITSKALEETFNKIANHLTILSVTHNLSSTVNNDQIFVIDKGKLIEQGNHSTLMQLKGYYYRLWEKQKSVVISQDMTQARISIQGLKQIPTFAYFDDEALQQLSEEFSILKMEADTIVFEEGSVGYKFYIIASGVVEVSTLDQQTRQQVFITKLYQGDIFGEVALIMNEVRNARITTRSPCIFLTLDNQQFQHVYASLPQNAKEDLLKVVAKRKR